MSRLLYFIASKLHTHPFNGPFPGLPRWASSRKVKPIWILLKQETVSGSGISWAICKSAPHSRLVTTPAPHHSVFYRPDALPAAQPTASKHWRHICICICTFISRHIICRLMKWRQTCVICDCYDLTQVCTAATELLVVGQCQFCLLDSQERCGTCKCCGQRPRNNIRHQAHCTTASTVPRVCSMYSLVNCCSCCYYFDFV